MPQWASVEIRKDAPIPSTTPAQPPVIESVTASISNLVRMSRVFAPTARRSPISQAHLQRAENDANGGGKTLHGDTSSCSAPSANGTSSLLPPAIGKLRIHLPWRASPLIGRPVDCREVLRAAARSHRICLRFMHPEEAKDANHLECLGYESCRIHKLHVSSQLC